MKQKEINSILGEFDPEIRCFHSWIIVTGQGLNCSKCNLNISFKQLSKTRNTPNPDYCNSKLDFERILLKMSGEQMQIYSRRILFYGSLRITQKDRAEIIARIIKAESIRNNRRLSNQV